MSGGVPYTALAETNIPKGNKIFLQGVEQTNNPKQGVVLLWQYFKQGATNWNFELGAVSFVGSGVSVNYTISYYNT
jgi:hypothetical protein